MEFTDVSVQLSLGVVIAVTTLVYTLQKIAREARKSRKEDSAAILQAAKEEDALLKAKLEARVEKIDLQLESLKLDVSKDIGHLRETYSNEIKNLGKKIEDLRDELRSTHSQLVQLLTTLIENKKD